MLPVGTLSRDEDVIAGAGGTHLRVRVELVDDPGGPHGWLTGVGIPTVIQIDPDERIGGRKHNPSPSTGVVVTASRAG